MAAAQALDKKIAMYRWIQRTLFFAVILLSGSAYAAGDYILEEKFHKELVKAEQGDAKAQYAIGQMYEKGRGTDKDTRLAFSWYSKSTQKGYTKAEYKLGMAYLSGKGIRKNSRKAYEWLKKSSDKGYVRAQYNLAILYEKGRGTEQNLDKAFAWYKKALAGGYDSAAAGMKRITDQQKIQQDELALLRNKKLASAAVIKKKQPVKPVKPKNTAQNKATPKPIPKPLTTLQRVQAGGWKKRSKAIEYLPSAITKCTAKNDRLECLSDTLKRNIGAADIEYKTKATLFGFNDSGTFLVTYRNKVLKVIITDEGFAESGAKIPVRVGWQGKEHKLTCVFEDDKHLNCKKNKLSSVSLHR